jgi:hypothetical protein
MRIRYPAFPEVIPELAPLGGAVWGINIQNSEDFVLVPRDTNENCASGNQDIFAIVVGVDKFFINQKCDPRSGVRFGWMPGIHHFEPTLVEIVELYGPIKVEV